MVMNDAKVEEPIDDADEAEGPGSEDEDRDEGQDEEVPPSSEPLEGEGSYTATRKYNADLEKALREGKSPELAEKARQALEGPEGKSLEEAERKGKARRRD
jgi:hypothetical protein